MPARPTDRRPSVYESRLQLLAVGLLAILAALPIAVSVGGGRRVDPLRTARVSETPAPDIRLDLNTADAAALEHLPGIGRKRAADIIAYRERAGRFNTVDDLRNISGIKDGIIRQLTPYVRADPPEDGAPARVAVAKPDTRGGQTLSSPPQRPETVEPVLRKKRPRPKKPAAGEAPKRLGLTLPQQRG